MSIRIKLITSVAHASNPHSNIGGADVTVVKKFPQQSKDDFAQKDTILFRVQLIST
jgi:hypothetical protein